MLAIWPAVPRWSDSTPISRSARTSISRILTISSAGRTSSMIVKPYTLSSRTFWGSIVCIRNHFNVTAQAFVQSGIGCVQCKSSLLTLANWLPCSCVVAQACVGAFFKTLCVVLWHWQATIVPQSGLRSMSTQSVGTSLLIKKVKVLNFQCTEPLEAICHAKRLPSASSGYDYPLA